MLALVTVELHGHDDTPPMIIYIYILACCDELLASAVRVSLRLFRLYQDYLTTIDLYLTTPIHMLTTTWDLA